MAVTNPEGRARYLAEEVLRLGMSDHEVIMAAVQQRGRPETLNMMEDMVIACHKELVRDAEERIDPT